jgi:hypothetical protein
MDRLVAFSMIAIFLVAPICAQPAELEVSGSLPEKPQPQTASDDHTCVSCRPTVTGRPGLLPTYPAGLRAKVRLTSEVNSKLPDGAQFRAELDAPILSEDRTLLPKGTIFHGHVESIKARRPLRSGAMRLRFDRLVLPDGSVIPAHLFLEDTSSKKTRTDSEGVVRPALNKKRLLAQLGGTALVAKVADDAIEEAAAASAGSARWAGLAAGVAFLLVQKGREARLRPGDMLEVVFTRENSIQY